MPVSLYLKEHWVPHNARLLNRSDLPEKFVSRQYFESGTCEKALEADLQGIYKPCI